MAKQIDGAVRALARRVGVNEAIDFDAEDTLRTFEVSAAVAAGLLVVGSIALLMTMT